MKHVASIANRLNIFLVISYVSIALWALILICSFCGCFGKCIDNGNEKLTFEKRDDDMNSNAQKSIYHYLDLVQINLKTPEYHAEKLISAKTAEECAYNILALGLIGENTPEVRDALLLSANRFKDVGVPQGYDWPDNAKEFKAFLQKNPDFVVDHYPGNRVIPMLVLIDECIKRLGIEGRLGEN